MSARQQSKRAAFAYLARRSRRTYALMLRYVDSVVVYPPVILASVSWAFSLKELSAFYNWRSA
jgi:hypothetical protein